MLDSFVLPHWLNAWLVPVLRWLLAPMRNGHVDPMNQVDYWHAAMMGVGGGILVPVAVLGARYWKIVPGQTGPG